MAKNDISDQLFEKLDENYIRGRLSELEEQASIIDKLNFVIATEVGGQTPYIGWSLQFIIKVADVFTAKSSYMKEMEEIISETVDRKIVRSNIHRYNAALETLKEIAIRVLKSNMSNSFTISDIVYGFNTMDTTFRELTQENGFLMEYPLITSPFFISFAQMFLNFMPIAVTVSNHLEDRANRAVCEINKSLKLYYRKSIESRLSKIDFFETERDVNIDSIFSINYLNTPDQLRCINTTGKNLKDNAYKMKCAKYQCPDTVINRDIRGSCFCFFDNVIQRNFFARNKHDCIFDYMTELAKRYEQIFKPAIDRSGAMCRSGVSKPFEIRKPICEDSQDTGRLTVTIQEAQVSGYYDHLWILFVPFHVNGDPYVKVLIDGSSVYRTRTIISDGYPKWYESFTTSSINKNSWITFEIWDDDQPMSTPGKDAAGNDDPIGTLNYKIDDYKCRDFRQNFDGWSGDKHYIDLKLNWKYDKVCN